MLSAFLELFLIMMGVILAPIVAQGIFKPKSLIGKIFAAFAGVILVIGFLTVWSIYQKDPLQLGFCKVTGIILAKPLPACAPQANVVADNAKSPQTEPMEKLFGKWRRPTDAECMNPLTVRPKSPHIEVELDGIVFIESIEEYRDGSFKTAVLKPLPVRNQRFSFRLVDSARVLEITPVFGGSAELWYRCAL